jgi:hypothetical protein
VAVLPVLNVSSSGIALGQAQLRLEPAAAVELAIFHRLRAATSQIGAEQPLRTRATLSRHDPRTNRLCLRFEQRLSDDHIRAVRQADHDAYASHIERWSSDAFLAQLAAAGDFPSDALDDHVTRSTLSAMNRALEQADARSVTLGPDAPAELRAFMSRTALLPQWVDEDRLKRGRQVLQEYAMPIGVVLFLKVLPTGYCSPALARALAVSGDLTRRPVRRSLLVLNMILELCDEHALGAGGGALPAAQRLRLLHAGVRRIVRGSDAKYTAEFGVPVSQEHMLATIIGFAHETLQGLRQIHVRLTREQQEDYYYLWLVFAWMLGVHPEGQVESRRHLPQSFDEAEAFQIAYRRRHFRSAEDNPEGVALVHALLADLSERVSLHGLVPFAKRMPYWMCAYFLSDEDLLRLRLQHPAHPHIARGAIACFVAVLAAVRWLCDRFDAGRRTKKRVVMQILSQIVHEEFDTEPKVLIPDDLRALRDLVALDAERRSDAVRAAS